MSHLLLPLVLAQQSSTQESFAANYLSGNDPSFFWRWEDLTVVAITVVGMTVVGTVVGTARPVVVVGGTGVCQWEENMISESETKESPLSSTKNTKIGGRSRFGTFLGSWSHDAVTTEVRKKETKNILLAVRSGAVCPNTNNGQMARCWLFFIIRKDSPARGPGLHFKLEVK